MKEKRRELRILLAAAECAPLSKTGGLADVVGALPKSLRALGTEARVITPYHRGIKERYAGQVQHLFHFYTDLGWRHEYAGIEKLELGKVTFYLVDNERYYGNRIYSGGDEEIEQYAFFSQVVLQALPGLGFEPDLIHCNDWHTAMIPVLAKTRFRDSMPGKLRYLLTIHNIAFQGKCSFGLAKDLLGLDDSLYNEEVMRQGDCADFLKAGCVYADRVSTVSPSYAMEIRTPDFAEGLEEVLTKRPDQVTGILNGIDAEVFDPASDLLLPVRYDVLDRSGKTLCKAVLQERMGLEQNPDIPVFAMVSRMTEQKGFALIECVIDELMQNEKVQFMLVGSGDETFENFMRAAEGRYRGRLCSYIGYNEEAAHLTYAGSDFFLMPSRFEPCGLGQLIAMRYGSIPIVRETGGLRDTVIPWNRFPERANGFSFEHFDAWELRDAIRQAMGCYREPEAMDRLITNAMRADFDFIHSAEEYIRLYHSMLPAECAEVPGQNAENEIMN